MTGANDQIVEKLLDYIIATAKRCPIDHVRYKYLQTCRKPECKKCLIEHIDDLRIPLGGLNCEVTVAKR